VKCKRDSWPFQGAGSRVEDVHASGPRRYGLLAAVAAAAVFVALAGSARGSSGGHGEPAGRIAVEGDGDVIVVNARSGRKREVAVMVESAPAWSPDGRSLAYAADGALRTVAPASGHERSITRLGGRFTVGASWSPGGTRLAFAVHDAYSDTARLTVVGRDGTRRRTVDPRAESYQVPQWSPTGRRIAYLRNAPDGTSTIWVVSPDGGRPRLLRRGVLDYPNGLSWSPGGARIAFVGRPDAGTAAAALMVAAADGTQPRTLAAVSGGADQATVGNVRWSPTGGRIAFLRWGQDAATDDALCVVDPQRGSQRVLVRAPYLDDVAWSPDGRWLAYLTENPATPSGLPFSIWIVRADGSGVRLLARLHERGEALVWGASTRT
jgi:Tol biopolymer transport system component